MRLMEAKCLLDSYLELEARAGVATREETCGTRMLIEAGAAESI
jgi:hypothetical protein